MLYGPSIRITDPEPFLGSLRSGSQKVAVGVGSNGSDLVLLGVPGAYPLSSGGQGIALVAAVPVDDFTDLLFLSEESSPVYSHIIRVDGTYVIRSSKDVQENYLEHIQLIYDEKRSGEASQLVSEMRVAMEAGEPFSALLPIKDSDQQHMYCLKLPHSEWYLVTIMPYNALNVLVDELSSQYVWMVFRSFALILLVTVLIFFRYLALTRRQIQDLEEAKHSTEQALQAAQTAQEVAEQAQVEAERAQAEAEQARAEAEDANKAKIGRASCRERV